MIISIAMTSYNGGKYIKEQINSILSQTVQDFELVICDDNSTDGTWDILLSYAKLDKRINIYRNDNNLGYKKNFEKAIRLCQGKYIALCDQDDIWTSTHLECLLDNMGDCSVVCGNAELINKDGMPLGMKLDEQESLDNVPSKNSQLIYSLFFFRNPFQGASMMVSRNFLSIALPIPDGAMFHDSWFVFLACFFGGFKYIPVVISNYRMHGGNVTSHYKRKPKFRSWINHLHNSRSFQDRVCVIDNILERVVTLDNHQKQFLLRSREIFAEKGSIVGRLKRGFFELKHYGMVFSCKGNHWL